MHSYNIIHKGQPLHKASQGLILLHGRGGTANDILSLADRFCDDTFYIAAPQATNNSWYPYSFLKDEKLNEPWLSSAVDIVKKLIDEISTHIPKEHIYIMGFSQGACLALESSARFATKYAGVVAFTGGLIGSTVNEEKYRGNFEGTKIFIGTSDQDPHVPLLRSQQSKEVLEKLGADVTLKVYKGMSHTITEDEINWVKKHVMIERS
jgi:phospholipase/carboxylesterase